MKDTPEVTIHIGDVYASREPVVVKTVLGSCIAAVLIDPAAGVAGMNHFMLADPIGPADDRPARFGLHAMELLIGAIQRLGGQRRRLVAKLFGGGHVLRMAESDQSVPRRNVAFIERWCAEEHIPVLASDLGGFLARRVHLETWSGRVLVRKLGKRDLQLTRYEEEQARETAAAAPQAAGGEVTLFDD